MTQRVQSVDALRGLIMIVMALDHTRDYFHSAALLFQPDDLTRTTAAIFFTRWITHFCAPVFMFTAGMGAYFLLQRGRTKPQLSVFLVTRGLWLMFLELSVVRFAMTWGQGMLVVTVLWGLGISMVALALLIYLPAPILALLSLVVVAMPHDPVAMVQIRGTMAVFSYPLVPWFAVMALGFCFGEVFTWHKRWMAPIGVGLTAAFVLLRLINVYGEPSRWTTGLLSFLRVTKYPPSLDFVLMTLGPAILLLAWLDKKQFAPKNPLLIFGRVPLFYFLTHLYVIHLLTIPLAWLRYGRPIVINPIVNAYPQGYGYPLGTVYLIWVGIVIAMYPLCLWFAGLKQRRRDWWLSYL